MKRLLVLIAVAALASCAKDAKPAASAEHHGERDINEWASSKGGSGYGQDSKGNWSPKDVGKRSQFEAKRDSSYSNKADTFFGNKAYKTGDYKKTSFWGDKSYSGNTTYSGKTDRGLYQTASRFGDAKARETGSQWAKGNESFETKGFTTQAAHEQNGKKLDRPSDAETDVRRRVYAQPEIHDWRSQRSLSVDQTKGLLGK